MPGATIRRLHTLDAAAIGGLADVLMDCVEGGASVSFMDPLTRERAVAFWRKVAEGVASGGRAVLVAEDERGICGTVQLVLDLPENQPHRADVAKMLVHRRARRRGLGGALLQAAEGTSRELGRTLLVLDAVTDGDAARLYARLGWVRVGDIPGYALHPKGGLCATTVFYRDLDRSPSPAAAATSDGWITPTMLKDEELARTVRLEPLEARHAPDLFAAADRELFRHTMQAPDEWSVGGFERELEQVRSLPGVVAFAIVLAEGERAGRAIGRTTFMDIRPEHRGVEIGRTWIGRAYHGTRVNPEAKYLILRHAFERLSPKAVRVQLTTNGTNLHSQAAIAKLGAVREGVLRKARVMAPGLDRPGPLVRDWVIFSILDEEWPAVRARLEQRLRGPGWGAGEPECRAGRS